MGLPRSTSRSSRPASRRRKCRLNPVITTMGAEAHRGLAARDTAGTLEKRRHPHGKSAYGKGVCGIPTTVSAYGLFCASRP